jgi:DNA replication and repair protein RecF
MTAIRRIDVLGLRNLSNVQVLPDEHVNIFFGANGSGKTSLLEAVYYLGLGRSFRSQRVESVIQAGLDEIVVFSELYSGATIGVSKSRVGTHVLKLMGERQSNWLPTARELPLQLLNSDSFDLLEGSSKVRRRFLDWGVFHVEHDFAHHWRSAAKCITQRNLLLKERSLDKKQIEAWGAELSVYAGKITSSRARYVKLLLPVFEKTLSALIAVPSLGIRYFRGWEEDANLEELLQSSLERDVRYGATQLGPHRADLQIRIGKQRAEDFLSRGQQKLLVVALKLAQGILLSELTGVKVLYLVDDLPAELDRANRRLVCELLAQLESQVFMTCVDSSDLDDAWPSSVCPRKFHVEHGKITPV